MALVHRSAVAALSWVGVAISLPISAVAEALVEAACQRLRAVLLTSLTTIAGLGPLLFETSLQAQFLIPMAASIAFGLAFSTLLVLLVVPALLVIHERIHHSLARWWGGVVTAGEG